MFPPNIFCIRFLNLFIQITKILYIEKRSYMLIYAGTKQQFDKDVTNNIIASKIKSEFINKGLSHNNQSEFTSWENSLKAMQKILNSPDFSSNIQIAVEYQIPLTSKRVDFVIAGTDKNDIEHVVIIELKQWEKAHKTGKNGIVEAYTGGSLKNVTHPSYQAYTYAKMIENFNETVQNDHINIHPCAYLHNYQVSKQNELTAPIYEEVLDSALLFIKSEKENFRAFIKKYITKAPKSDILSKIDNGRIKPSKALQDTVANMISGNKEFIMLDEQKVIYEEIKELVYHAHTSSKKSTIIIEGGPGTGKSVIAIQLLSDLISNKELIVNYVTKNAAPRNVYFEKLKQGKALNNYVKNLFKGSGTYYNCDSNTFDCLIADEAHRLNEKSGIFKNKGENQIKEIINASKVSVFFIDENQAVTASDIGSVNEIKKWAHILGSKIYSGNQYKLTSQFRCNGSNGYISFLDNMLGIDTTDDYTGFDSEYEFKIFDDPNKMREILRSKNAQNNKSRLIAGYCYEWVSKKDSNSYDISLKNGFLAKWNFNTTSTWAIDEDSFDQVGCIHTSQGLEFDYVGIIIGNDLRYENNMVITDPTQRAKSDQSLRGLKKRADYEEIADKIIRNTYKTLLSRGQKGCYVYCENEALSTYIKQKLQK